MDNLILLTCTEFGRTAAENGQPGHRSCSHASCWFAIGGGVKGGHLYGDWPGFANSQLHEGAILPWLPITETFWEIF